MKKGLLFFLAIFVFTINTVNAQNYYCPGNIPPTCNSSSGDYINSVQLGTINNTNSGPASGIPYYNNYTNMSTLLVPGVTYTLTLQCGTWPSASNNMAAWIDYNHNFLFDPAELLGIIQNMTGSQTSTIVFTVPLTAVPGNSVMRVREIYNTTTFDPCATYGFGETEDYGIFIPAATPYDIAMFNLVSPLNSCNLGTAETIVANVFNAGTDTIFQFNVNFDINNGFSTGSSTINATIPPLTGYTVSIPAPADFSTIGNNYVTFWATTFGDTLPQDDTAHAIVIHYPTISSFPWLEDFESATPPWIVSNGAWSVVNNLGFPNLPAHGGTQLAGAVNGASGDLISPCLDFTTLKNPAMKFYFNQYTPFGSNYVLVYGSNNGGISYTQLDSLDLYNSNYSSYPGGWKQFQVCLGQYARQPNISLKFVAVPAFYDLGIDDVLIFDAVDTASITAGPTVLCGGGNSTVQINNTSMNYAYFVANSHYQNVSGNPVWGNGGTLTFAVTGLMVTDTLHVGFVDSIEHGNCSSFSDSAVIITVYPMTVANAGNDTSYCSGGSVTLQGTGGLYYNWTPSVGLNVINTANPVATPLNITSYILQTTNQGGCASFDTVVVYPYTNPIVNAGANTTVCGSNIANIGGAPTASGGSGIYTTYSWTPSIGLSSASTANPTANPSSATTYTITVTDSHGCFASDNVIVKVDGVMSSFMNTSPITCNNANNGTASVSVSGGTAPYTYQWSTTPIGTNTGITNATPNTYYVNITDFLGCTIQDTASFINPAPISLTLSIVNTSCGLCNGMVVMNPVGGSGNYVFSSSPFLSIFLDTAKSVCNGTYAVTVTDGNGCTGSSSATVTGPGGSTTFGVSAGVNATVCAGYSAELGGTPTMFGASAPYTFTWVPATGLNSASSSNPLATPTATTTYVVTAVDAMGCTKKDTVVVTVNPKPNANAGSNVSYCYGMAGSIGTAPVSGYTYSWAPITGLSSANIANPTVNVMTSEMYTLTVTDANGCFDKDSVQVNMLPLPQVSAGSDVIISLGNSTTLNGSGALTYLWTPSTALTSTTTATTTASPTVTSTYVLTGTDANGCVDNDQVTVFVYDATGISVFAKDINLKVFPNPFEQELRIQFSLMKSDKLHIRLFDMNGKAVKDLGEENMSSGSRELVVNTTDLSAGTYLLMIEGKEGVDIKRVIKQ